MKFYTVDVKNITSELSLSDFSDDALNNLADMIIESEGIIRPLILKNTGLETYTVVDGHFEYYAAVRAREKNPRKCEMVNAFVIAPKNENIISKQVAAFRKLDSESKTEIKATVETNHSESIPKNENFRFVNKQIDEIKSELAQERQERHRLYEHLKLIESQIPKQITPLEAFNNLSLLELTFRLRTAGFTDKKALQVVESVEKERKKKKFETLKDVLERVKIASGKKQIKGISGDKMVDIVDSWSRIFFLS